MNRLHNYRHDQRGAALLVLFFVIFAVSATLFLSSVNTHVVETRRHVNVRAELENAKQALIAYAITYNTLPLGIDIDGDTFTDDAGPGHLLCPDINNDGLADANVIDCTNYVRGRVPEMYTYGGNTVDINDTFADSDQQFWYVISPAFSEIATTAVNHLTTGDLSIDGQAGYIAVIIAPGEELAGQNRAASQTSAANYLEQDNVAGTSFINSYPANPDVFNDQVIGIKASELKLSEIRDKYIDDSDTFYLETLETARQALAAFWSANGSIPTTEAALSTYMQDGGYGWLMDEGYLNSIMINYTYNSYPYIRYNLDGCTTRWYWFIPVFPYSPNTTYANGTAC